MWGSSVPSVTHRLQAAIPTGRAIPQEQGRAGAAGGCSPLPALLQLIYSDTDSSFVKHQTRTQTPGCSPCSTATWIPKGTISLGNFSITRCSCQSQAMQGSDSQPGTTHSVAATGTPALGTKLHPSQIPRPAADRLCWQHRGDGGTPQPFPSLSSDTSPSPERPQHPLAAPKSSQALSRFSDAPFHSAPRAAKS